MKPALSIADLKQFCIVDPQLVREARDRFRVVTGPSYNNQLHAPRNRYPLLSGSGNLRSERPLWERSRQERIVDLLLNVSPWVFEIRCNLPIYRDPDDPDEIPFVVDRMITVELLAERRKPHYHALMMTSKGYDHAVDEFADQDVTCELLNLDCFTETDVKNADFCYGAVRRRQLQDMRTVAAELAEMLLDSERRRARYQQSLARSGRTMAYAPKCLDQLIDSLARRLAISRDEAYARFCAALALGFLAIEPGSCLGEALPLRLAFSL